MPYVDSLQNLTLWYRQLLAESCGKNSEGITPVNSSGTVDQHSQLQLYLDGPKDKFFTFISRKKIKSRKLDCTKISKKFNLLQSKSLEDLLRQNFLQPAKLLFKKVSMLEKNRIRKNK